MADDHRYCFDSSSLIAAWHERYPPTHFKSFWASLGALIAAGVAIAPEEVRDEISVKDDGLRAWSEGHASLFQALDLEQQQAVREILAHHRLLAKDFRGRNRADAFVIALAKTTKAAVVSEEKPGSPSRPKIPEICARLGVRQIGLLELIQEQGWQF